MDVPHIVEPDIEQYRVLLLNIVIENMPRNLRDTLEPRPDGINIVTDAITDIVNEHWPLRRDELLPGGRHLNMIFATIERMLDEIPQGQPADAPADAAADIGRNGGRRRYKTSKKSKKRATRRRRSSKRKSRKVNKRRN